MVPPTALPTIEVRDLFPSARPGRRGERKGPERNQGEIRRLGGCPRRGPAPITGFPGLVAAVRTLPAFSLILDGVVCLFDDQPASRFEWLRRPPKGETATPPVFVAFDCLYARRKDLRERPLGQRRLVLEAEVASEHYVLPARRQAEDGLAAWAEVLARLRGPGGEGPGVTLRGRADAHVAQGEAAALSGG